jgi:hypothetical protein
VSDYLYLSEEEQSRIVEAGIQRGLDEPMPPELNRLIRDLIEPHTINMRIKHGDVMDCMSVAFPVIREWLREHPDEGGSNP